MKQTSSLLIRTRTQGLLWRNHWNHQSGLGRAKMTTRIKEWREKLHSKSIMRELLESRSPSFRTISHEVSFLLCAAPWQMESARFLLILPKFRLQRSRGRVSSKERNYCCPCAYRSLFLTYYSKGLFKFFINLFFNL